MFIDRLTAEPDRHEFAEELLAFVGEPVTSEVREFVDRWPVIHKVVPDSERTATVSPEERRLMLNGDREFQEWVERLGFSPACGAMSA